MFENAVKVKASAVDPLESITDSSLPAQLGLTIADLRRIEKKIQAEYGNSIEDGFGYVRSTDPADTNFFETAPEGNNNRSLSSLLIHSGQPIPFRTQVFMVKGAGFKGWQNKDNQNIIGKHNPPLKTTRQYPIIIRTQGTAADRSWGGLSEESAAVQYLNALILNSLIERHSLPQSTYSPISVRRFEELPLLENGSLKVVSLSDYCNKKFHLGSPLLRVPTLDEAEQLSQLYYAGGLIQLRVPPTKWKAYPAGASPHDDGWWVYSKGILHNEHKPKEKIKSFVDTLGRLVKTVHNYDGTFMEEASDGNTSSIFRSRAPGLGCKDISLDGIVCDLDTLHWNETGQALAKSKEMDIFYALGTVISYAGLFEDKKVLNSDSPLVKGAIRQFNRIYPVPSAIMEQIERRYMNL